MNNTQHKQTPKRPPNNQTPRINTSFYHSKPDYHGITLKQYFMMCDAQQPIKEEHDDDYGSSQPKTPAFMNQQSLQNKRMKIKTEIQQDQIQNYHKNNHIKNIPINFDKTLIGKHYHATYQKTQQSNSNPKSILSKQKQPNNLRLSSIPTKNQLLNRSTLTSFYQLHLKKKNFLQRVKADKNREKQLRLSDAFFITKYGSKFQINHQKVK